MPTTPLAAARTVPRHRLFGWALSVLALGLLFGALPSWIQPAPEEARAGLDAETPAAHETTLARHHGSPAADGR